jgi:hypothetical protein
MIEGYAVGHKRSSGRIEILATARTQDEATATITGLRVLYPPLYADTEFTVYELHDPASDAEVFSAINGKDAPVPAREALTPEGEK